MLRVWIDGSCEPINPGGTARYGLIIKDDFNNVIHKDSKIVAIGKTASNNVAEYSALAAFLDWYEHNSNYQNVNIYSDSQLLVNQMNGKWKVKGGLYTNKYLECKFLFDSACKFLNKNPFTFIWIPREENTEVDMLSKE